jgi:hypothetical protein
MRTETDRLITSPLCSFLLCVRMHINYTCGLQRKERFGDTDHVMVILGSCVSLLW